MMISWPTARWWTKVHYTRPQPAPSLANKPPRRRPGHAIHAPGLAVVASRTTHMLGTPLLLAVLVVGVLGCARPAAADDTATAARPEAIADQSRPLDLVKASVARVLAIVQSQPAGT